MNIKRLEAAKKHYEALYTSAEVTIEVYLTNAAGIGEHPQIMEELRKQIEILTDAKDQISTIEELISKYQLSKN